MDWIGLIANEGVKQSNLRGRMPRRNSMARLRLPGEMTWTWRLVRFGGR